jgi:predicted TIM-barrel fold metal-dependent hydrolase
MEVPTVGSEKLLMISVDGHVAAPMARYREFLESEHHERFDEFLVQHEMLTGGSRILPPAEFFEKAEIDPYVEYMIDSGAIDGEFDVDRRLDALSTEGVAAEVLFPNGVPFQVAFEPPPADLRLAGMRAYNRWLADFVAQRPERFVGQALVSFDDVDIAVETAYWARDHGLKGVMLPGIDPLSRHQHWDPALDPFWSTLEETGLIANVHGGSGLQLLPPPPGLDLRVMNRVIGEEFPYFAHRVMVFMMWSGVFERHPALKTVWTEQYSDWIPRMLRKWDWTHSRDVRYRGKMLDFVPRNPREYWQQNCWAGMSLASKAEVDHRYELGVDKMMFGVDFPHVESTYPKTLHTLQTITEDLTDDELRKFLGLNAAALWQLDLTALEPVVKEVGFTMDQVRARPPTPLPYALHDDTRRPLASV